MLKMKLPFYFYRKLLREIRSCQHLLIYILIMIMLLFCTIYLLKSNTANDNEIIDDDVMIMLNSDNSQKEFIDKKGVHVIVGQWTMEKNLKFDGDYNLTSDILNTNNYNPILGAGENGQPVYMNELEKNKAKLLFNINKFNLVASDKIAVNRSLPDARKENCRNIIYDISILPTTSIIIVFHNEAYSTLLRTVHSVINRSPNSLIEQIVLVDDASERVFLKEKLDNYINNLIKITNIQIIIVRSKKRIGLVRARLLGTEKSTGDILTFLDAHVEVNVGWLPPLLARIKESPHSAVCPIIDIINEETFGYSRSFDLHWGAINWNLHFRWFAMGEKQYLENRETNINYILENQNNKFSHLIGLKNQNNKNSLTDSICPFKTPFMAGGLFSIDRKYFDRLGKYDEGMDIWGGENIDLSLRIHSCGGRVEIHPCSHVAHLFRKSSPYSFPRKGGVSSVLYKNLARVLEVWMNDDYKLFFYSMIPVLRRTIFGELNSHNDFEYLIKTKNFKAIKSLLNNSTIINEKLPDIDSRKKLKEDLKCKDFSWFLDNVWPQHFFPTKKRFFGQIKHLLSDRCMQIPTNDVGTNNVGRIELTKCIFDSFYKKQLFVYDKQGFIMTDDSLCIDVSQLNINDNQSIQKSRSNIILIACSEQEKQKWKIEFKENRIRHLKSNLCLELKNKMSSYLTLKKCSKLNKNQLFEFVSINFWNEI